MKRLSTAIFGILLLGQMAFANTIEGFTEAEILSQRGAFTEANTLLDNFIQNNPSRLYDMANAWFLKSYNYMQLGDYAAALYSNNRSLKLRHRLHSEDIAHNYMREGSIYLLRGDYEQALNILYAASEMPIEDPQIYALIYAYIASAQQELGNYEKALEQLIQSLEILEIELGDDHPDFATGNYDLGRLFAKMGEIEKADEAYERAFSVAGELENGRRLQANILNARGVLYQESYPAKAMIFYKKGLKIIETQALAYQPEAARIHLNIVRLKMENEPDTTVLWHINRGIKMLQVKDSIVFNNQIFAEALTLKALYFLQQEESGFDSKKQAFTYCLEAIDYLNLHLNLLSSDAARFKLLEEERFVFETAIQAAMTIYEESGDIEFAYKAFKISEESKAIVLRANRMRDLSLEMYKKPLWEKEKEIKRGIREVEAQVALDPENKRLHKILAERRKAFTVFMTALIPFQSEYANYRFSRFVPEVKGLQSDLESKTAILSYFIGTKVYYVFCIGKKEFKALRLPLDYSKNKTGNLMRWMSLGKMKGKSDPGVYTKINMENYKLDLNESTVACLLAIKKVNKKEYAFYGHDLYNKLIAPIEKNLKGKNKLQIIADGQLYRLPFEALLRKKINTEKKIRFRKLDYLIEDFEISYSYSVAFMQEEHKRDSSYIIPQSHTFLGFAPVFSEEGNTQIMANNVYLFDTSWQSDQNLRSVLSADRTFNPLIYSKAEVEGIERLFMDKKYPAASLFNRRANEKSFKLNVDKFEILHLATHSFVNTKNPLLSGIAFSQVEMEGKTEEQQISSDGILYAAEILALPIAANLVVLSSCESSVGPGFLGDGPFSLSRAFIEAGAAQVMASLWKVYDNHTLDLMLSFYTKLLNGSSEATALRKAKLKMIKNSKTANPKIWAGFILMK